MVHRTPAGRWHGRPCCPGDAMAHGAVVRSGRTPRHDLPAPRGPGQESRTAGAACRRPCTRRRRRRRPRDRPSTRRAGRRWSAAPSRARRDGASPKPAARRGCRRGSRRQPPALHGSTPRARMSPRWRRWSSRRCARSGRRQRRSRSRARKRRRRLDVRHRWARVTGIPGAPSAPTDDICSADRPDSPTWRRRSARPSSARRTRSRAISTATFSRCRPEG